MRKLITRTITTYKYTFGHVDLKSSQIVISDIVETPYKMGRNDKSRYCKSGNIMLGVEEKEALYGMTLETFLMNAKPMNPDGTALENSENGN